MRYSIAALVAIVAMLSLTGCDNRPCEQWATMPHVVSTGKTTYVVMQPVCVKFGPEEGSK